MFLIDCGNKFFSINNQPKRKNKMGMGRKSIELKMRRRKAQTKKKLRIARKISAAKK